MLRDAADAIVPVQTCNYGNQHPFMEETQALWDFTQR